LQCCTVFPVQNSSPVTQNFPSQNRVLPYTVKLNSL
jgi:hypothetical protein